MGNNKPNIKGSDVKALVNTDKAYEILDSSTCAGGTWSAGGCTILSRALNKLSGYPIYAIYNTSLEQVEHFGVKTSSGAIIDADGEHASEQKWLSFFRKNEHPPAGKLVVLPFSPKTLRTPGIKFDDEAAERLAVFMKQHLKESILKQLVESLVKEVLQEASPEAPKNAPFGQYLFAPYRSDLSTEEQAEENTYDEEEFYQALYSHYGGRPEELGAIIKQIKQETKQGHYQKILAPPNTKIYRYISDITPGLASQFLRLKKSDVTEKPGKGWYVEGGGEMIPGGGAGRSGIHSWSTKLDPRWIENDLIWDSLGNGRVSLLLVANTSDKNNFFFMNPENIEDVESLPDYAYYQNEVISYGPVTFEEASFFTAPPEKFVDFGIVWKELTRALGSKKIVGT